jgi:hypothetical protein
MNITIYHGHIDHRHGYNHHAATSHEQFFKWAADYCRKSWPEQFDKDDPDHAIPDTDEEIVSMFFERAGDAGMGEGEYFHHDITQIEIPDPAPSPHLLEACQELVKWLYKICTDDVKLVLKHEPTEEHLSLTRTQPVTPHPAKWNSPPIPSRYARKLWKPATSRSKHAVPHMPTALPMIST